MQNILWMCEQYLAGQLKEKSVFQTEDQARDFARKISGIAPDTVLRIEAMPIQNVWN